MFCLDVTSIDPSTTAATEAAGVSCLLSCGHLSEQQALEVRVNGELVEGWCEERRRVFAWTLTCATDEVSMAFQQQGRLLGHWRGCWNERDAILHTGTLPVRVIYNGQPQDERDFDHLTPVPSDEAAQANGQRHGAVSGITLQAPSASDQALQALYEQALSPSTTMEAGRDTPWNAHPEEEREQAEEHDEEEYGLEDDEDWEDDAWPDEEETPAPASARLSPPQSLQEATEPAPTPPGQCVAAFHAGPFAGEEDLQALQELVARMPPKTVIIDLRVEPRTRQKARNDDPLSKARLRAIFGARYWNRSWAIAFRRQYAPPDPGAGRTAGLTRYIVAYPDHLQGIPELTKRYQQEGYSFLFVDSVADYEASARRAVIEELRRHLPALHLGPLR